MPAPEEMNELLTKMAAVEPQPGEGDDENGAIAWSISYTTFRS
ncbi:hypothetical protein [Sphaerisporangium perillae]|nr:hypothetical protein [Sphaerisporangium perillae]